MAIEEFGKSLLEDVRKRKDSQARAARKQEEKNAWITLGANVGGSVAKSWMKENTREFLANEAFTKSEVQQKAHQRHIKSIYDIQSQIETSGKTEEEYFLEQYAMPVWTAKAAEKYSGYELGSSTEIDNWIRENAKAQNEELIKTWREARTAVDAGGETDEEYQARVGKIVKRVSPTSISGWLGNKATSFFSGVSEEDMKREALQNLLQGKYAQDKVMVAAAVETFNKTRNLQDVKNLIEQVDPPSMSEDERYTVKTDTYFAPNVDGKLVSYTKTTKKNNFAGPKDQDETVTYGEPTILDLKDPVERTKTTWKTSGGYDYVTKVLPEALTRQGWITFTKTLNNEGIVMTAPKSVAEVNRINELASEYQTYPEFVRDPDSIKIATALIEGAAKNVASFEGLEIAYNEDGSVKADSRVGRVIKASTDSHARVMASLDEEMFGKTINLPKAPTPFVFGQGQTPPPATSGQPLRRNDLRRNTTDDEEDDQ